MAFCSYVLDERRLDGASLEADVIVELLHRLLSLVRVHERALEFFGEIVPVQRQVTVSIEVIWVLMLPVVSPNRRASFRHRHQDHQDLVEDFVEPCVHDVRPALSPPHVELGKRSIVGHWLWNHRLSSVSRFFISPHYFS